MSEPVKFEPCAICREGDGRFMVYARSQTFYVCSGCFMRREDHLRLTGEDLLICTPGLPTTESGTDKG
jgi:hypothetical protein